MTRARLTVFTDGEPVEADIVVEDGSEPVTITIHPDRVEMNSKTEPKVVTT